MDAMTGLLDGPRARGAFLLRALFAPPFSIRIEDGAALTVVVLTRGSVVFTSGDGPVALSAGDVLMISGPAPYVLADSATTPDDIRILPGQICLDPAGHLVEQSMALGTRTWGNSATGTTVMLIGTYQDRTEVGARVLSRLPAGVVLRQLDSPLVPLLATEIIENAPGQAAVLDRLLDLLVLTCLRQVFAASADRAPRWYAAQDEPVIGEAIRLLQQQPAHPWTVATLASACGVSRAVLARRFNESVGEPPMTFLTGWRIALAADLLTSPNATLASVARRVGYSTPFALSTAFKRIYRVSPAQYRSTAAVQGS